jgi:N-acetylmuramoyl-L-alanine amidase
VSKVIKCLTPAEIESAAVVLATQPTEKITAAKARTGADIVTNAGLFNMNTGATECALKVSGKWVRETNHTWGVGIKGRKIEIVYKGDTDIPYDHFVSGYGTLILVGKIKIDTNATNVIKDKRGRTAVGTRADGGVILYVCQDGTDALTGPELAARMLELGCVYAVNLDGGGSSAYLGPDAQLNTSRALDSFITITLAKPATAPTAGLTITTMLTPAAYRPARTMVPTSVTIHATSNADRGATAAAHAKAQAAGNLKNVAVHYYVDDHDIYRCLEDTQQGWHSGDSSNVQGGNYTSISIEVCENQGIDQRLAFERAAALARMIMGAHGIHILRTHHDWTGKKCPDVLLDKRGGLTWEWFAGLVAGSTPAPTAPTVPEGGDVVIRQGDKSDDVRRLQAVLNAKQKAGLTVDGIFGPATAKAVSAYQQAQKIVPVDPMTWGRLGL